MIFRKRPRKIDLTALIEQFRRERKTGRLTFTYADGFGDLYFRDGELVDAGVEETRGAGAVFLALTLPVNAVKFDARIHPTHRTITESWDALQALVNLRLNEGQLPSELFLQDDEFETAWSRLIISRPVTTKRAATYRAVSTGQKDLVSTVAANFFTNIAPSSAWKVATACAIIAFIVLTAVTIVALNDLRGAGPAQVAPDSPTPAAPTAAAPSVNANDGRQSPSPNDLHPSAAGMQNRPYVQSSRRRK